MTRQPSQLPLALRTSMWRGRPAAKPSRRRHSGVPHQGKGRTSDAMPPHASSKRPVSSPCCVISSRFISGGQGEWSVAIKSMTPSLNACHSASRLAALRMGGAHLKRVAPSAISSAAQCQIEERARFYRHRQATRVLPRSASAKLLRWRGARDVQAKAIGAAQWPAASRSRLEFGFVRPRGEVSRILLLPVGAAQH